MDEWLNDETIAKLAPDDPEYRLHLTAMRARPDEVRPYEDVYFWGAFILHGETGPLKRPASLS